MDTKNKIEEALKEYGPAEKVHAEKAHKAQLSAEKLAVILIRGTIGMKPDIKDTLFMMRLRKTHTCIVLEKNPGNLGRIFKVKDYVAYGEIDDATLKELVEKRGKKDKQYFTLNSPRKGFARRGIKTSYSRKGALGYRGKKINDLIKRML